jgi:hypothetical protein
MSCSTSASTGSDTASDVEVPSPKRTPKVPQTSLMIRNVPVLYSAEMLLAEWPNEGTFDFFYLPWNVDTQRNLSYAFLNFTTEAAALSFVQRWQKQRLPHFSSRKPLNISFADVQGLADNLRQLQKKRVNLEQCHAVVFENGCRVSLKRAVRNAVLQAPATKHTVMKQHPQATAHKAALGPFMAAGIDNHLPDHCLRVGHVFSV